MSKEELDINQHADDNNEVEEANEIVEQTSEEVKPEDGQVKTTVLSGMFKNWFLDYASYVILDRAVPHIDDGLKPVQRRILYSMKRLDDGRYNKVANIIGHTMQFHPHGDASIGDALVQIGQKDLLVDPQGNWGNILTGDRAAAPRYIEARLSKFALDVVFNSKTTIWEQSYDGRNKEPVTLPVKFPLMLTQGIEGIAVGLASKILPHNFIELIDASILYLQEKDFELFPDFNTAGYIDVSRYNDGLRGGSVKVRAKIEKEDKKTLKITELPFGKTTSSLIDSIIKANDKGTIKIKKIDDNTAENVEILIDLPSGVSTDITIDGLYAFTDCEVSISPNSCIICNEKPIFIGVKEILKRATDHTLELLKWELEIRLSELNDDWHFSSLEKIFIEKKIYLDMEGSPDWDNTISVIDKGLTPYKKLLRREVTREDIERLPEIKMKRITKHDAFKADEHIKGIEFEITEVKNHLENIIPYTINYFKQIKKNHGKGRERKTEIRSFDTIEATKVVVANSKLYVDRKEGFIGSGLKKDEFVCECSDIDDIIVFLKDGKYIITKISDKAFVGKDILHVAVFNKSDDRTVYNLLYRDGRAGKTMAKRFAVTSVTRDKEYDVTKGTPNSKILYFSANANGEAEIVKIFLKPRPRLKKLVFEFDFGDLAIKGRSSMGNTVTKNEVHKVTLKEQGVSTLGGLQIWFDDEVLRLNTDNRGKFIGKFNGDERILVISKSGYFKLSTFDLTNHFEDDILLIEKFNPNKVYSVVYFDAEQEFYYLKRFQIEHSDKKLSFIGDYPENKLLSISEVKYPRFEINFGGKNKDKESEIIEVSEFIGVKSYKAKGKRLTKYNIKNVKELEAIVKDEDVKENFEEPEFEIIRKDDNSDDTSQMTLDL